MFRNPEQSFSAISFDRRRVPDHHFEWVLNRCSRICRKGLARHKPADRLDEVKITRPYAPGFVAEPSSPTLYLYQSREPALPTGVQIRP